MKTFYLKIILLISIMPVLMLSMVTCKKKSETHTTSPDITAVAYDDHIELSWNSFGNADYYVITDDFYIVDGNNHQTDQIYNVLIAETSQNNYIDLYPFAGMNHYKVTAVNENGSNGFKEVSCYFSEGNPFVILYPNPTRDVISLETAKITGNTLEDIEDIPFNHITIETIHNQIIYDTDVDGGLMHINMSQYNNGIYIIHVNTDDGELFKRFVVAHD